MSRRIPIGVLRQIVIALFLGESNRQVAKAINGDVSYSTVSKIRKKIKNAGLDENSLRKMSDHALSELLYGSPPSDSYTSSEAHALILSNIGYYHEELKRTGVNRFLLWEEFMVQHADTNPVLTCSYQTFCRILADNIGVKESTFTNKRPEPASVLMIDFAGDKLYYTDRTTNKEVPCTVFVAILGYSLYSYVDVLPDARTHNVLRALNNCLNYLGGVPEKLLTDNMTQLVKKADRYEPTFTDSAIQWANHYGIFLSATRVARPRDKAGIERLVSIIYNRIYAALRDRIFYSYEDLRAAVMERLEAHNNKRLSGKLYSRRESFIQDEQPKLNSLPEKDFVLQKVTKSTVSKESYVLLGEDKSYYSVPHKYIGKRLDLLYTAEQVEVYDLLSWVASHPRNPVKESHTTNPEHLPPNHKAQLEVNGWTKEDYLKKAKQIGDYTTNYMENMFALRKHESHAYRSCQGLLNLGSKRKFGTERLENACELAGKLNKYSYKDVENILRNEGDIYFNAARKINKKRNNNQNKFNSGDKESHI